MLSNSAASKVESVPPSAILETCLHVADLHCSSQFYSSLFGYPVMQSDERFCAFSVGGRQVLLLFARGSDPNGTKLPFGGVIPPHGAIGSSHIGFAVASESLPTWRRLLAERDIPIESTIVWPAGGTSIYFRDPDGHLLELITPGVWPIY